MDSMCSLPHAELNNGFDLEFTRHDRRWTRSLDKGIMDGHNGFVIWMTGQPCYTQ